MFPPYLFDRHDSGRCEGVDVRLDVESSVITLSVNGPWRRTLRRDVSTAMNKCLTEHPAALIIDLHGLDDSHAASPATWITARRLGAELHPPVQVFVHVRPESPLASRLHRMGAARFLPIFATPAEARSGAEQRIPMTSRLQLHLHPDEAAVTQARHLVTDACTAWRMLDLAPRGRLVTTELVANAVTHAGTPITVVLSRRGSGLHLVVRDGNPGLARLPATAPAPTDGRGLMAVHAAATAWGVMPTGNGKAVWAIIRAGSRRP